MTTLAESQIGGLSITDLRESAYLTDGLQLFRVVKPPNWSQPEGMALLEDCRTLEQWTFTTAELSTMALRIVSTHETA